MKEPSKISIGFAYLYKRHPDIPLPTYYYTKINHKNKIEN